MRRRQALLALCLFAWFLPWPLAAQTNDWITFRSDEGRFSVLMPVQPTREEKPIVLGPGAPGRTVTFAAIANRQIYVVGLGDYAPGFRFNTQAELKENQDNFVKEVKGTLLSSKPIIVGTDPGLEFTVEIADRFFARGRSYVFGSRPYNAVAVVPLADRNSPNITRFLDSFAVPGRR